MRMWMVNPAVMCRKHLLGEHVELHMFVGSINRGISMTRYLSDGLLEPAALRARHEELVKEMERRGYKHNSILPLHKPIKFRLGISFEYLDEEAFEYKIDSKLSLRELASRCPECRQLQLEVDSKTKV